MSKKGAMEIEYSKLVNFHILRHEKFHQLLCDIIREDCVYQNTTIIIVMHKMEYPRKL